MPRGSEIIWRAATPGDIGLDVALLCGATTAWTQITQALAIGNVAGTTVRLRFTTQSDTLNATSFFFDSLELNATYCQ